MSSRVHSFALAAALAAAVAAPGFAADDGPTLTAQAKPVGQLLDDVKGLARTMAGPMFADRAVQAIDEGIQKGLGEKGFTGLDLLRPLAGYVYLEEMTDDSSGFLIVPVTAEDDFLDLLKRVGPDGDKIKVEPVKGNKGLYALTTEKGDGDVPVRLRFHAKHAYIGVNVDDEDLDAKELFAPADVIAPADRSPFAVRAHLPRLPAGLKKQAFDKLEALVDQANDGPIPDSGKKASKELAGLVRRLGEQVLAEGDVAAYRLTIDPATGESGYEFGLTGKPGTPLAKAIAARKPTTNRFAGLVGKDAAAGLTLQLPLFAPEIRKAVALGLEEAEAQAGGAVPPVAQPLVTEVLKGLERTAKTGSFDVAAALSGPDAGGFFSVAVAVAFEDTAELDKVLRKLHADAPEEIQNQIKLDAAKVGGVAVHRMPAGLFLPSDAKKLFGDKPAVALALAPKGVYLTFGPDAVGAMKAALTATAEPGPARPLDVTVNPARLHKAAVAAQGEQGAAMFAQVMGTDDAPLSLVHVAVEGGDELKVRIGLNVKGFPRAAMFGVATVNRYEAVPPPAN